MVHVTGRELELLKSSYSMISWKLYEGKERLCNIKEYPGDVLLQSEKYTRMALKLQRNEPTLAERQLGVCLTLCGNDEEEFIFRVE